MAEATVRSDLWARRYHPGPATGPRLVCFPHAGGAASFFFPLSAALAPGVDVLAVQYPGRQDRRGEPLIDDIGLLADRAAAALRDTVTGRTAFFGHSMGATVAFEVARRLERGPGTAPALLVVSGRRAPSRHRDEHVGRLDDAGLVRELTELSGTDGALLADEELLRLFIPVIRNDYRAVEAYRCPPGARVGMPVAAFVGEADPKVSLDEVRDWSKHTEAACTTEVFPGGHFYLTEHRDELVRRLAAALRTLR